MPTLFSAKLRGKMHYYHCVTKYLKGQKGTRQFWKGKNHLITFSNNMYELNFQQYGRNILTKIWTEEVVKTRTSYYTMLFATVVWKCRLRKAFNLSSMYKKNRNRQLKHETVTASYSHQACLWQYWWLQLFVYIFSKRWRNNIEQSIEKSMIAAIWA